MKPDGSATGRGTEMGERNGGRARVLFIDDEPRLLKAYERLFAWRWDVWSVASCGGARELLTHVPFDLVVADLEMPDGSGVVVLEEARIRQPTALRALSSAGEPPLLSQWLALGFVQRWLPKPVCVAALENIVVGIRER